MEKESTRFEAFCDGVFAIAITLLILDIKVPELEHVHSSADLKHALYNAWPAWFAFLLSFITLLIAWNNHHNHLRLVSKISGVFSYANGFLMLTVIVFPFPTAVLSRFLNTPFSGTAIILYCFMNVVHNIAWVVLAISVIRPKSLTRSAEADRAARETLKTIIAFLFSEILITILAFWFPISALCLMTALWIAILIAGITVTKAQEK